MVCPKCGKEMRNGYLFGSKDGAFSFANNVPSALENAKNTDGFVKLTGLKVGGRASVEACCCDALIQTSASWLRSLPVFGRQSATA